VLVREAIAEAGIALLRQRFDVVEDADSDLGSIIGDFDAIVVRSATSIDAGIIERADRLKVIGRAGIGVDNIDVDAATRRGIVVANAPEATVVSAAEHALALLLAVARNVPQAHAALKRGTWDRSRFTGIELAGKTLGVLGLGRIGRQVARRALGLGLRVVAYDPYVVLDRFRELGVEPAATPEDVYRDADLITLHLPLNDETGLLDESVRAMGRRAIVNTARGLSRDALRAIRKGKVRGRRSTSSVRSPTRDRCSSSTRSS
jgi:D-3-phosphoglycerate dehydrogenase